MKWIMLIGIGLLMTGCTYYNTEVVEYRQVAVAPIYPVAYPVVESVSYGVYGIQEPLDVTATTIDYY
jgi:hypothetical protein